MNFDIVYLPPIHPIGKVNRKGRNNTLVARPEDVGSPWAIGSDEGGHDAVNPLLGTLDDFRDFVAAAHDNGLEIALDLALQAAPDHPWVTSHPEWFTTRADGTIAYAENPPKKYQDIYPLNWDNDPKGLREEVLRVILHWVAQGVKIFRVDNPHTKALSFWQWCIAKVKEADPDVLFLAEAFTRPAMMNGLGKIGFTQSYSYFTWRTTALRDARVHGAAAGLDRLDAAELLAEHPGHPAGAPAGRRPADVQDPDGAGQHALAVLGHVLGLGAVRARPAAGRRGEHRQREVRAEAAGLGGAPSGPGGPWRRTSPGSTRSAGTIRRCTGCAT